MSKITLTVRKADDGLSPASSKKHLLDKQQTLHLQADKHTDFQLADEDGNLPQDIILTQEGEDLLIGQVGEEKAAAVIKDYYVHHAPFPQTPYTPPEALTVANNPQLAEAAEIPLAPSMSTGAGSGLLSSTPTLAGAGIFTGLTATALGVANHKSKKHPSSEQPSPDNGNNTKPTDPAKPDNGGNTKPNDPAKPDNGGN
ncbi:MAG: hypothetical protein Q3966_08710, partial [Neisseria sp.]|nr:hypothetical protein [Neisseria sp.]